MVVLFMPVFAQFKVFFLLLVLLPSRALLNTIYVYNQHQSQLSL